ncbi:hypothetical protein C8J57DRAFT_1221418 [Mycena rebaudengoi]|nr:hypothetical protein C8J57DRAFT_1221418 [Mycena rebaudengoi]
MPSDVSPFRVNRILPPPSFTVGFVQKTREEYKREDRAVWELPRGSVCPEIALAIYAFCDLETMVHLWSRDIGCLVICLILMCLSPLTFNLGEALAARDDYPNAIFHFNRPAKDDSSSYAGYRPHRPAPPLTLTVHRRRRAQLNDGYGSLLWSHRALLSPHPIFDFIYFPGKSLETRRPSKSITPEGEKDTSLNPSTLQAHSHLVSVLQEEGFVEFNAGFLHYYDCLRSRGYRYTAILTSRGSVRLLKLSTPGFKWFKIFMDVYSTPE